MTRTKNSLTAIEALDLQQWTATFWLVKRGIANHAARYNVLRVNTDAKLQKRLKGYVIDQLQGKTFTWPNTTTTTPTATTRCSR